MKKFKRILTILPYIIFVLIRTGLIAVIGQCVLFTGRNTMNYLAWAMGNGDLMHGVCIPHRIPRASAWGQ